RFAMPDRINDVRPFRALHYDPAVVGEVGACLSQPYDVISPAQQEAYYRQHPHNVIRLILNRQEPSDDAGNNRYTRARDLLAGWRSAGILHGTRRPSFWVYEQQFDIPGIGRKTVKGFVGAVRLADYAERRILPHEKVLTGPLEDRIRLTETTNTQFEYIWSLYQDRAYVIDNILDEQEREKAIVDFVEQPVGVHHRMWRLTEAARCDAIARTMAHLKITIADGHHRYQTMLTVRDRMRKLHPGAGPDAPWEFIMMFLVNSEHEGLTILPTHRLIDGVQVESLKQLGADIMEHFHVKKYSFRDGDEAEVRRRWLRDLQDVSSGEHKLGAYFTNTNGYYLLTLRDEEAYEELVNLPYSSTWKLLDVNILNTLVLEQILGITEDELAAGKNLTYTKDLDEALERTRAGEFQVALALNPSALSDVIAIAENGERMPRKSTHFYPKPVSGLVFYPMDPGFHLGSEGGA
ncbi:MAG: DUF1015 domain-containing protein, partial [Spirochaetes bacterium]|nr:DUF1015 domain-containing protein [Spirochaetota bacterium]